MIRKLKNWATTKGRLAVLGMAELAETGRFISQLKELGQLDARFFQNYLVGLVQSATNPEPHWKSIILLSCPRPAHRLIFEAKAGPISCFIPPTYVEYRMFGMMLLRDLRVSLGREFPLTAILRAPLKSLAVRSGLVTYGRNNITYSGEYGSYHQLVGFISEAELEPFCLDGPVAGPQLPDCARCSACVWRCPTQAIDKKRFLLHAEKCLTLFTENPGILPPVRDKLDGEMLCLAGCLACQTVCPANKDKLKVEPAPVSFTATETKRFLADEGKLTGSARRVDPVWKGIRKKLMILGMLHYQNRIGRNLHFIMNAGKI
jgi:epoxyqueuosine reductase